MIVMPIDTAGAQPLGAIQDAGLEPALAHALADELVALTQLLGDLACDLAEHPDTLRRHMHSLQAVDRITQVQLAVADVLRSSAPIEHRLRAVTLEELGVSLRDALGRYRRDGLPVVSDLDDAA